MFINKLKYLTTLFAMFTLVLTMPISHAGTANTPAPDFTLASNQGKNIKLSELSGQVVMINFWASWCGPCRQEMPVLDALYKKYSPLGFTILGVNVEEDSKPGKKLVRDLKVTFPILYDTSNKVSKLYNVLAMPTTVIVDRSGRIRYIHQAYKPGYEDKYAKQISKLIRE